MSQSTPSTAVAPAVNTAGMVGHCAVRFQLMGDRAIDDQPTAAKIAQLDEVVGKSIADGGSRPRGWEP